MRWMSALAVRLLKSWANYYARCPSAPKCYALPTWPKWHPRELITCRCPRPAADTFVETSLKQLENDDKVQEIARMFGGVKITPQTLAHAREMLES